MNEHPRIPYFTNGVKVLTVLAMGGIGVMIARFVFGIGAVTNLNDHYPWGIWIGIDVATGVALAAGGFTTAFIAHVMHRERFHPVVRPALLTAMLGYTFVALGVFIDLGRYYNIWHVMMPWYWQGNSALFEVGVCVMMYLTVLYIEFLPIVVERFKGRVNWPGGMARFNGATESFLRVLDVSLGRVMSFFIIAGVVLSCAHQSSLGTLMVISGSKLHPLWQTTVLPMQFLLSAFAVGLAMAIFESYLASRSLKHPFELDVVAPLGRMIPFLLTIYLTSKLIDMVGRETYVYLFEPSVQSISWLVEVGVGVVLPGILLMIHRLRRNPPWLFAASAMIVGGVALNRLNVFVIGYKPLYADKPYIPSWTEALVTVGFISILIMLYRFFVMNFPVLEDEGDTHHA